MARRTTTATRSRSTRSRQEAPAKPARRTSTTTSVAKTEVVAEEAPSSGMAGVAILTSVLLLAAILCVDAMLGRYGSGVFF